MKFFIETIGSKKQKQRTNALFAITFTVIWSMAIGAYLRLLGDLYIDNTVYKDQILNFTNLIKWISFTIPTILIFIWLSILIFSKKKFKTK